jgi:kynurenine formamidase
VTEGIEKMTNLPKYQDLPIFEGTGEHHAWGVWGQNDELGMINLLTPDRVKHAASLVRKGRVINIEPSKGIPQYQSPDKVTHTHHVNVSRHGRSDYVDGWQLHGGWGHLDSFQHFRYRQYGYYGGRQDEDIDRDKVLGIHKWAEHGIVGRGVLVDVAGYLERQGQPLDPSRRFYIGIDLIEKVLADQRVSIEPGDIVLLRTGWQKWYFSLNAEEKASYGGLEGHHKDIDFAVLDRRQETAAWLWDHQVVAIWGDNGAVESHSLGDPEQEGTGSNHQRLLAMMGIGIGEFFTFEDLAADCAEDGIYEFMVTAKPVSLPMAAGSPAHAYAIK